MTDNRGASGPEICQDQHDQPLREVEASLRIYCSSDEDDDIRDEEGTGGEAEQDSSVGMKRALR